MIPLLGVDFWVVGDTQAFTLVPKCSNPVQCITHSYVITCIPLALVAVVILNTRGLIAGKDRTGEEPLWLDLGCLGIR